MTTFKMYLFPKHEHDLRLLGAVLGRSCTLWWHSEAAPGAYVACFGSFLGLLGIVVGRVLGSILEGLGPILEAS